MGTLDPVAFDAAVRAELELVPAIADLVHRVPAEEGSYPLDPDLRDHLLAAAPLIPWLERTVVRHPGWEDVLRAVRLSMMRRAARGDGVAVLPYLVAFAHQAWNNEYSWWGTHEGRTIRSVVEANATERLATEPCSDDLAAAIAAIAMYTPIRAIEGMAAVAGLPAWRASPIGSLITRQIDEVHAEETLVASIPALGGPPAPRLQVAAPWPRVMRLPEGAPRPLAAVIEDEIGVLVAVADGPEVLVPSAGTGERALERAGGIVGARVLATDPSRRHLAAALRQAQILGLSLEVLQADVEDLTRTKRHFHFIDAATLGEEADPERALEVLVDALRPGGVLRASVHASIGREAYAAAADFVEDRGFPPTRAGLRRSRRAILALPADHPARGLVWRPEFYSLTGFYEAIWLEDEPFDRDRIEGLLPRLGAELLGFVGDDRDGSWRFWARKP